jgi:PKD repeat protein
MSRTYRTRTPRNHSNKITAAAKSKRPILEILEDRTLLSARAISLADSTMLSDTAAGNVQGPVSVSKDGQYVVYTTTSANAAAGQTMDHQSVMNVFLFDRSTGTSTLISHASTSTSTTAHGSSKNAVISADGKWIAFVSNSDNLVSGETLANDTYTLVEDSVRGGIFTLTVGNQTTGNIAYNASADTVKGDLEGLSTVGSGNVSVTDGPAGSRSYTITFIGNRANGVVSPLSADGTNLTSSSPISSIALTGGHNEFLCDQYWVFLYNVQTGATTLVSHAASDQGTGYSSLTTDGTNGILTGAQAGQSSLSSQTTSVSISGDGKYIAYVSTALHLVSGQQQASINSTNPPYSAYSNAFVYDRSADTNYLVSRDRNSPTNSSGAPTTPGDNNAYVAVIDQNGDTIAFTDQSTNLVSGQTINSHYGDIQGETPQFFVAKIGSGSNWGSATMALASHDLSSAASESITNTNGPMDYPAPVLTPDGHWMVYMTDNAIVQSPISGTNAGMGDNYYLYDTTSPTSVSNNTLITHTPGNSSQVGDAGSDTFTTTTAPSAAISDDGKYVAFYSAATNLTSTSASAGYNVFLFTASSGNVTRITNQSISTSKFPATSYPPFEVTISGDGRYVGYVGLATADVSGLTNVNNLPGSEGLDALVYDQGTSTPTYTLVSHATSSTTTTGTGEAYAPVINESGNAVLYLDDSDNLRPTTVGSHNGQDLNASLPTDGTDLYAYSLTTPSGYTPQASNGTNATVTLRDPNLPSLTANGLSEIAPEHAVSDDGNFTVFVSTAPNLVASEVDSSLTQNVYLYSKSANTVTLLSHSSASSTTTANGESANAVISGDGKTILFYSFASNLLSGQTFSGTAGSDPELYLYDNDPASTNYGKLKLVSHTSASTTAAANGTAPFSPNGLSGYSSLLYSTQHSAQGLALPSVSTNGQYIAYLSNATNLSATSTGSANINVFLYDRSADTNSMVSHASGATTTANGNADTVAISGDGTTVAFTDKATNLLSSTITTSGDQLYVWSRTTNSTTGLSAGQIQLASHASSSTTTAASFSTGTSSSKWGPLPPSLSSNGDYVAYYFGGNNLVASQSGASSLNAFRYDVGNNVNILVSHQNGSNSTAGDNPTNANLREASGPAISSDGRYIAYANNSTNLLGTSLTGQNGKDNVYLFDASQTDNTLQNTLVSHASGSATTPDAGGGTSPSISSDGRYVSFIDLALDTTSDINCTYTSTGYVRLFDRQASSTTQPTQEGAAFDPTPMSAVRATLAPTAISGDGSMVAWDGSSTNQNFGVTGDLNGNIDVFELKSGSNLNLTANPINTTEGSTFTGTVATLTDTNTSDLATSFIATIDWGDGSTSTGVVSGSSGSFTIRTATGDTHSYADEGSKTFVVTVKQGSTTLTANNTATIGEGDTLSASVSAISPVEGTALTNTQVATFTTTYTGNVASDFSATIDWGDGHSSTGVVSGSSGNFVVKTTNNDSHTYADEGSVTVKVTITDDSPGTATTTVQRTVTVGEGDTLRATATAISSVEGTALTSTQVATFTSSYVGNVAGDFTATIDWGDGHTSTGAISGSAGSFVVKTLSNDSHTYADEGSYTVKVTIADDSPGTATATAQQTVNVGEGDVLSTTATAISPTEGIALTGVQVATFTSSYTGNVAGDFTATIDWGDGQTSKGVITGSAGSFVVNDTHTYADEGSYTVKVKIVDDTPGTATITAQQTVTVAEGDTLNATATAISPVEGSALTNVQVASFTSTYANNSPSDFKATIDWGDGQTSNGMVTFAGGKFIVSTASNDSHTYADEGGVTVKVTITDDGAGTATATVQQSVTVGEGDTLQQATVLALSPTETVALPNTQVASFTSSFTVNVAADFRATVDWGDGSTSTGVVTGSAGNFAVSTNSTDVHSYADEGSYTVKVTITDDSPGTATITAQRTITVGEIDTLNATATAIKATEGTALASTQVATFTTSYTGNVAGDFTALINWGDGQTSTGVVTGSAGNFTVSTASNDTHVYVDEGSYTVRVTIADDTPGTATAMAQQTVAVADADTLKAAATAINPTEGTALAGVQVASFTTTYTGNVAGDFTAVIEWGDGQTSNGLITGSAGNFIVSTASNDTHVYTDEGTRTVRVTIADDTSGAATISVQQTVTVAEGDTLSATSTTIAPTEGTPLTSTQVATFTSTFAGNVAGDFTATINWGDGQTSAGVVTGSGGTFVVSTASSDTHAYADEGTYTVKVTITDDAPGTATISIQQTVTVAEADTLSVTLTTFTPVEGTALTGERVATFTSTYTGNTAGDFTATIDWGDGQTSAGVVTGSGGNFIVSTAPDDTHTFADEGDYTVKVTVNDPGTATASDQRTITVEDADTLTATATALSPVEGKALTGIQVATFTSTYVGNTAGDFTATIDWGDGQSSTGVVTGSAGKFVVSTANNDSHVYVDEGSFTVRVTINDDSPGAAAISVHSGVKVVEGDVLGGTGLSVIGVQGQALTSVAVASFTSTFSPAADFTASIDWGNGTITSGTVTGSAGNYTVTGSNTYSTKGGYTIVVTINDDSPGTANLVLKGSAAIYAGLPSQISLTGSTVTSGQPGGTVVGTLSTTDPNTGQTFTYSLGGVNASLFAIHGNTIVLVAPISVTRPTTYSVDVTVVDSIGFTLVKTFTITVDPPPTITTTAVPDSHGNLTSLEGTAITLISQVTDSALVGTTLTPTYLWTVLRDGKPFSLPSGTATDGSNFVFTPTETGTYTVTLSVSDPFRQLGAPALTIEVSDAAPTVDAIPWATLGLSGGSAAFGTTVNFTAPGDEFFDVRVDYGDGTVDTFQTSSRSIVLSHDYTKSRIFNAAVSVTDVNDTGDLTGFSDFVVSVLESSNVQQGTLTQAGSGDTTSQPVGGTGGSSAQATISLPAGFSGGAILGLASFNGTPSSMQGAGSLPASPLAFFDVRAKGDPATLDAATLSVTFTFTSTSSALGTEQLLFLSGGTWQPVVNNDGSAPVERVVLNADGFTHFLTAVFGPGSNPPITDLTGTVFTLAATQAPVVINQGPGSFFTLPQSPAATGPAAAATVAGPLTAAPAAILILPPAPTGPTYLPMDVGEKEPGMPPAPAEFDVAPDVEEAGSQQMQVGWLAHAAGKAQALRVRRLTVGWLAHPTTSTAAPPDVSPAIPAESILRKLRERFSPPAAADMQTFMPASPAAVDPFVPLVEGEPSPWFWRCAIAVAAVGAGTWGEQWNSNRGEKRRFSRAS